MEKHWTIMSLLTGGVLFVAFILFDRFLEHLVEEDFISTGDDDFS